MRKMSILHKTINFIELTDFLDRIEVVKVTSDLHAASARMLKEAEANGTALVNGETHTFEHILQLLKAEEAALSSLRLTHTPSGPEAVLEFTSGHSFTIVLKNELQYAQTYQYLIDYPA